MKKLKLILALSLFPVFSISVLNLDSFADGNIVKAEPAPKSSFEGKLKAGQVVPGVLLVKFKKNTGEAEIKSLDKKYKANTQLVSAQLNLYKVKLPAGLNVEQAVKLYSQEKIVEYAEADRIMVIQKNKSSKRKK
jgi:hypothetical protein